MIERLIPEFDVLYENFRPGVMDRLRASSSYLRILVAQSM